MHATRRNKTQAYDCTQTNEHRIVVSGLLMDSNVNIVSTNKSDPNRKAVKEHGKSGVAGDDLFEAIRLQSWVWEGEGTVFGPGYQGGSRRT